MSILQVSTSSLSPTTLLSITPRKSLSSPKSCRLIRCSVEGTTVTERKVSATSEPLLLRAVKGEVVDRPPVWLMRQAGRYMKSYQTLCEKYPSFRDRSENADLVVEISLQPWKVFKPDGGVCGCDRFKSSSISDVFRTIVKKDGYRGLAGGWLPRMLFHAPAAAICWSTYETVKKKETMEMNTET